jgi:hypothetical protein
MFCDPVEILRYRIDLVIERAIGELRRFFDEIMVPPSGVRFDAQAVAAAWILLVEGLEARLLRGA